MATYYSAAKINLDLRIKGKRSDGYHELSSVMQSVSLFDRLDFTFLQQDYSLDFGKVDVGDVESNTITKSWNLLKEKFSLAGQIHVTVKKNIPIGAGLAGGSSNAAAVFHCVNDYFSLGLSMEELCRLGVSIGADVPFCIMGGTALAEGIGEKLTPLAPLPLCDILLVSQDFSVSTKDVFQGLNAPPFQGEIGENPIGKRMACGNLKEILPFLHNDLEEVTLLQYPKVKEVKEYFLKESLASLMSGSGPSVFAIATGKEWKEPYVSWDGRRGKLFHVKPVSGGVFQDSFA